MNYKVIFERIVHCIKNRTNKYDIIANNIAITHTGTTVLLRKPNPNGLKPPSLLYANPGLKKWNIENIIKNNTIATFTLF